MPLTLVFLTNVPMSERLWLCTNRLTQAQDVSRYACFGNVLEKKITCCNSMIMHLFSKTRKRQALLSPHLGGAANTTQGVLNVVFIFFLQSGFPPTPWEEELAEALILEAAMQPETQGMQY